MERNTNGPNSFDGERSKDSKFKAQKKKVYLALYKQPQTMLMVSKETGILRANICRYVAEWRKLGCIDVVKTDRCRLTRFLANYYTTDPQLFKMPKQLKMFDLD